MKQVDRNIFKGICAVIAGGLILLGLIYYGKDLFNLLSNMDQMKAFLEQFGASSMLVGILLYAAQILIAILPGEIIEVLFGVLYGSIGGMAFCLVGNLIGSTLIFLLTKRYGKKFVQRFISEEKMDKISFFKDKSRLNAVTFILFLIPGTPKDIFTYLLGLTNMKLSTFLLISSIARIPSIYSSTLVGANLGSNMLAQAILIYAITGIFSLGGYLFYRFVFQKKAAGAQTSGI